VRIRLSMRGVRVVIVSIVLLAFVYPCLAFAPPCVGGARSAGEPFPDLSGRWVTVQQLIAIAELPFLGEVTILTTVGLFSEACQSDSRLTLKDAYCFTDVDVSAELFATNVSDATMRSIQPDPRNAELRIEGGETWLVHDWHTEVRGAVLDDPVNDELPDYRSDPRVVDMDGDGKIGFTIPAELIGMFGGDTYVVQRFRYRLQGRLVDPDTIIGTVEWSTEQVILWATDALLMMPFTQSIDPDPTVHRFLMRRIDETWDCDSIRERLRPLLELLGQADLPGNP
jgi:hypothetical protein